MTLNKTTGDPLLYLDFYHHIIAIDCSESSLVQKLKDEFHFFVREASLPAEYKIEVHLKEAPVIPSLVAVKLLEHAIVYRLGTRQYIDYFGEALTIWDSVEKTVQIFSQNPERLFELSFLAIHSILGQELDRDGLCRLHAVAVSINSVAAVVMLPSKGGKSTLLKNLLDNPEVKIISDDMPLCDLQGNLHSFPSKMSLGEKPMTGPLSELEWHEFKRHHFPAKWTASLAQMKDRLDANPSGKQLLLVSGYRLSSGQSLLSEVPKWKMISPMMEHMIIGIGLPQIIEMFLKFHFTDVFKMAWHAAIRTVCAFKMVRKARCYHFYMGPDKTYNAQLLLDLIYEHQTS